MLAHEPAFTIGDAEFRPPTREVVHRGERTAIEPRVMQLLVALYRANGSVVGKDDLTELCWNGRTVGEDAINRVVHLARVAAKQLAGDQFRIETITKVGYRLTPNVQDRPPTQLDTVPGPALDRRTLTMAGAASAAAAMLGAAGWTFAHRDRTPREARTLIDDARKSLREGSVDSPANAVGTLRQATRLAPDSAEAWGLLALAYMIAASAASLREAADLTARGISASSRAYALEPHQPDALAARLWTIPRFGNWLNNERACRAALNRHPNHAEITTQLGSLLTSVGRMREALPLFAAASRVMPRSPQILTTLADIQSSLGMIEDSDATVDHAFDMLPRSHEIWGAKFWRLMYGGRAADAIAMISDSESWPVSLMASDADC